MLAYLFTPTPPKPCKADRTIIEAEPEILDNASFKTATKLLEPFRLNSIRAINKTGGEVVTPCQKPPDDFI
jgi:hypothetical protein